MYFMLPFPSQSPGISCWFYEQLFPSSLFFRELQWCGKNVIQHKFFFISYTLRWNRCSLWGRNVFLCWLLYTVPVPWREIPPQTATEQMAAQVSCCLVLSLPFWPLWPWCCAGKSVLVWCLWLLCWMCLLWWVFYRGGNRRQQRVKSWTRSKAETWMETLPRYQLLRYLVLHEKFFWFLNLFSRRDRTNELSFVPSDPSKWI